MRGISVTGNNPKFPQVLNLLAAIALAVTVLWLYWPTLRKLFSTLAGSEDYSYGLLLPLIGAYIAYLKWPRIRRQSLNPSWAGLVVIALGFALFISAELAAELYTTRVSFNVVLTGLILLVGGWSLVRLLIFPIILLFLMVPLPALITYKLTLPLQVISSSLATWFLQALGVPVLQQGNIIDLGASQLQIVSACSGLRYILPLLAVGAVFCYFFQRNWWKAAVLIVSVIPLAMAANALRVAGMGLYDSLRDGFWHHFTGWLIFIGCLGGMAFINRVLKLAQPPRTSTVSKAPPPAIEVPALTGRDLAGHLLGALGLTLLAFPLVGWVSSAHSMPLKQSFDRFPLVIDSWQGRRVPVDPEMIELTQSHDHFNAEYVNPEHDSVSLWIAYYETQKKAGGFVHSPKGCLVASGWAPLEVGILGLNSGSQVNYLLMEQFGQRIVVFYWYFQRGRWLTSEYWNKFYMAWDGLFRRRTDGALIRLITPAGENLAQSKERLISFTRPLTPLLSTFIPN